MLRKLAATTVVAATLTFGGCSTLTPTNVTSLLQEVAAITRVACKAVPAAAALVTLINAGVGAGAAALAAAFCSAFQSATPVTPPAASASRRFGASRSTYMCAGSICGWRV
jgi:hypothetical protein